MGSLRFKVFAEEKLENAIALIGFPSLGLVSSIATGLISKKEGMSLHAGASTDMLPPYCVMKDGVPGPQIRMYCKPLENGGAGCDSLLVIVSETIPKPEIQQTLSRELMGWLHGNGVKKTLVLDSMPMFGPEEYGTVCACSDPETEESISGFGIETLKEGIVRGLSGTLLYEGAALGMPTVIAIGKARSEMPDPRGAAKLLESLSGIIPELKVDTEPLYDEAEEIEKRIADAMEQGNVGDSVLYG
ncbi:MAG: proteasome assembly chaperone family protein [Thermoplasmatales archaeon]|nr:proteasome assembly chaperone family protein [Thermoplasmatales archaeon]